MRLSHPAISCDDISLALGWDPSVAWSVAHPRVSHRGEPLNGTRSETYWCGEIPDDSFGTLAEGLEAVLGKLKGRHDWLTQFIRSGGRVECFIGVFVDGNCGMALDAGVLRRVAWAGVSLSFDIYGSQVPG